MATVDSSSSSSSRALATTSNPLERDLPWLHAALVQALQRQRGHALLVQGQQGIRPV